MGLLEDHYLMIQMIPIQKFCLMFNEVVLEDKGLVNVSKLQIGRMLINLNYKAEGLRFKEEVGNVDLTDE